MSCDSHKTKRLQQYACPIKKYCGADDKTIKALPKLKFEHVSVPRVKDIAIAKKG